MLSAVLRSEAAVRVSVQIMKSFVEMRHFIANNAATFEQIRGVVQKLLEHQKTTDERFERVFDYMEAHDAPPAEGLLRRIGVRRIRALGLHRAEGRAQHHPRRRLRGRRHAQHPREIGRALAFEVTTRDLRPEARFMSASRSRGPA